MKKRENRYIIAGILFGLLISVVGFGVMNIFWAIYDGDNSLNGLYDYRAATIGDGLYLPLLVGCLYVYTKKNSLLEKKDKMIANLLGLFAGAIGFFEQISWLKDENIGLNWTIPKPHYFTPAGWYHATFFALMFLIIAKFFVQYIITMNRKKMDIDFTDKILHCLIWMSGAGFLYEHFIDDFGNSNNYVLVLLIVFFLTLFLVVVLDLVNNQKINAEYIGCCLSGLASSFGIAILLENSVSERMIYSITYILLSVVFVTLNVNKIKETYLNIALFYVATVPMALSVAVAHEKVLLAILLLVIDIFIAICQRDKGYDTDGKICKSQIWAGVVMCIFPFSIMSYRVYLQKDSEIFQLVEVIVAGFLALAMGKIANRIYAVCFNDVIKEEKRRNECIKKGENYEEERLKRIRTTAYVFIITLSLGVILQIIVGLNMFVEKLELHFLVKPFSIATLISLVMFATIVLTLALLKNISRVKQNLSWIYLVLFAFAYMTLVCLVIMFRTPYIMEARTNLFFQPFLILGVSGMVTESFYSNLIGIRGKDKNITDIVSIIIVFIGNVFTIGLCIIPNIAQGAGVNVLDVIECFVFILASTYILPSLVGRAIEKEITEIQVAATKPLDGIKQNGILGGLLAIVGGVVVVNLGQCCTSWASECGAIFLMMTSLYWPLMYCAKNNVKHLAEQEELYLELKDRDNKNADIYDRQFKGLVKHLRRQNLATIVALMLYSAVLLLIEAIDAAIGRGGIKEFVDSIIPRKR